MERAKNWSVFVIVFVILLDQCLKTYVKNTMFLGEEISVFENWFIIHFTENRGMAFGLEFSGEYGKLLLTLFRLVAIFFIGYGIRYIIKNRYPLGLVICLSLIFAGACGNLIDSIFYGVIYGYAPLLHGNVVDMLFFPLLSGRFPDWFPLWAGEEWLFFRPVFNLADAAISIGVFIMLIFQGYYFKAWNNIIGNKTTKSNSEESEVVEA